MSFLEIGAFNTGLLGGGAAVRGAEIGLARERPKDEGAEVTFSRQDRISVGVDVRFSKQFPKEKKPQERCVVFQKN